MTNPVILYGTQSNGETLPVQVDATGRLVAEGLQGPEGPEGPEGPAGGSFPLPADPFEDALLGWKNGTLAWIDPETIVPPSGTLWADYLTSDCGWAGGAGTEIRAFDGSCDTAVQTAWDLCCANLVFPKAIGEIGMIEVRVGNGGGLGVEYSMGGVTGTFFEPSDKCEWVPLTRLFGQTIDEGTVLCLSGRDGSLAIRGYRINGQELIDPRSQLFSLILRLMEARANS